MSDDSTLTAARRIMAERDEALAELAAIKAQAEDATEYVLAGLLREARADAERLAEAGEECASDLAAEVHARYGGTQEIYPSQKRRYERDMEPVEKFRRALEAHVTEQLVSPHPQERKEA